jgi:hypothetical protein
MQRNRIIVSIAALLAGVCAAVPTAALAGGPLLSGYGPPGAGAQTIVGAALLNGPKGGSGGGSTGGGSTPAGLASATGAGGTAGGSGASAPSVATGNRRLPHSEDRGAGFKGAGGTATATHPRAEGANSNSPHLGASTAVMSSDAGTSWFSGADLLALALAAGALAAVALATVRLTRTEHE